MFRPDYRRLSDNPPGFPPISAYAGASARATKKGSVLKYISKSRAATSTGSDIYTRLLVAEDVKHTCDSSGGHVTIWSGSFPAVETMTSTGLYIVKPGRS